MFPVVLDLTDRLCLVVGGGPVGRRKAVKLSAAGAIVRVVCLEARPGGYDLQALEWLTEPYHPRHLQSVSLVVTAATPEVNQRVLGDARARGIWGNAASDSARGDLFFPAVLDRGRFTVAVSTHGQAPALAAAVRDLLGDFLDPAVQTWAALLAEMRSNLQAQISEQTRRHEILRRLAAPRWLDCVRRDGEAATRAAMLAEITTLAGEPPPDV